MNIRKSYFLYAAYAALPGLAVFLLGYGGVERSISVFFQIYFLSLVALLFYDGLLFFRCLHAAIHKTASPCFGRFVVITGTLLCLALLTPALSKALRRSGALVRLKVSGGDAFCAQLLSDASRLTTATGDRVASISSNQLPRSFRRIDGESARIQGGKRGQANIQTSGRPYATGWILVPDGSSEIVGSDAIRVTEHIFRY